MKTSKLFLAVFGLCIGSIVFFSCLNDDVGDYSLGKFWVELVTVVPQDNGSFFFRTDNGATLWPAAPVNSGYKPKEQQRVLLDYTILSDSLDGFSHYIKMNHVSDRLTKAIAEDNGVKNDSIYGNDPVNLATINGGKNYIWIGDGYLNLYFETYFGGQKKHFVNLINTNPEKPYELEFRHHAYDDPKSYMGIGFVAFDLSSLPPVESDTVQLSIKMNTFDGEKIYNLKYVQKERVNAEIFSSSVLEGLR